MNVKSTRVPSKFLLGGRTLPSRSRTLDVSARYMSRDDALRRIGAEDDSVMSDPRKIKRLYRKRALASHPDLGGSEVEFAELHAAYQFVLAISQGRDPWGASALSETANQTDGWNYHDWYWNFKMDRGRSPSSPRPPASSAQAYNPEKVHAQLDGLKKRARNRHGKEQAAQAQAQAAPAPAPIPNPSYAHAPAPTPAEPIPIFDALHAAVLCARAATVPLAAEERSAAEAAASTAAAPSPPPPSPIDDGNGVTWARVKGAAGSTTRRFMRSSEKLPNQLEGLLRKAKMKKTVGV